MQITGQSVYSCRLTCDFWRNKMKKEPVKTTDELLRELLLANLAASRTWSFIGVRVGVLHGIVHLAGDVPSLEVRRAAADLARQVPGVRGVVNRIDAPGAPRPNRTINLNMGEENDKVPE
jgi:osmotically-inducible protein OsmY